MSTEMPARPTGAPPAWQPVKATDRRVLGVLVEKAKTTPDAYPMSLNALVTGANQKNNRAPVTQLTPEEIEASLDRLRQLGAVAAVQGSSRVERYRHYLYEWLGVDKVELAVMAELLLRGVQTVGELRGRAARMEPIADLAALRPVLQSLINKGLVLSLTPEGRGQVVSHALYLPEEMEKVRRQAAESGAAASSNEGSEKPSQPRAVSPVAALAETVGAGAPAAHHASTHLPDRAAALVAEVAELRAGLAQLKSDFAELSSQLAQTNDNLKRLQQALGE